MANIHGNAWIPMQDYKCLCTAVMTCVTEVNTQITQTDAQIHSMDEGLSVDVTFLDLAKAFDKVPHQRLLEKLKKHGTGGKLLAEIRNWLQNRRQMAEDQAGSLFVVESHKAMY